MSLTTRPPVITIMGHVDHGKTSLLDYIRSSRVASKEAGGITQHIGAYQIEFKGQKLTFIDTPGHAAFNKMRERGSKITDIVILVVAADDGVKPQTVESIRHIKAAGVPFIVAFTKIDRKDIQLDNVRAQLAEHDVVVREFSGEVDTIGVSSKTGEGIDKLLESLVVMGELLELKADTEAPLKAVVIESTKDDKRGSLASVIVQQGTLSVRQDIVAGEAAGRVRALMDDQGQHLQSATPGTPVEIIGLKDVPVVGAEVLDANAEYAAVEEEIEVEAEVTDQEEDPFADWDFSEVEEKEKIKLVIRADVEGTLEVIMQNVDDDQVEVISSGVGQITEQDLELADTADAAIIAFHIKIPGKTRDMAKKAGVKIKSYDVIYQLIEDLQKQILKLMDSTIDEVVTGEAEILQIFEMKGERIAGCRVKTGEIKKHDMLHLKRGDEMIVNPVIKAMMHGKEEISSVKAKNECGLTFKEMKKGKKVPFQVGDILVAYKIEDEG